MLNGRMHRRGFTILEVLIAVAVVLTLFVTILPALQSFREAARRSQCKNNLKLFGLSIHNYHDVYNCIPPGWVERTPYPGSPAGLGWSARVLPFMDQSALYEMVFSDEVCPTGVPRFDSAEAGARGSQPLRTVIESYRCPSDTTSAINTMRGGYATSNYSGVSGNTPHPRWAPLGADEFWPGLTITPVETNGTFHVNGRLRFRDFTDGLSNTLMIGERSAASGAGIWVGVRTNNFESDQTTDCSPGNEINTGINSFSSNHLGGAQFLMCDGSVHFISEEIDSGYGRAEPGANSRQGTYQNLSQRNDGNPSRF